MPIKDSKYGNGLLPPDTPPAPRFPHVRGHGEAEVRVFQPRITRIINDWWPQKVYTGSSQKALAALYESMAGLQEALILARWEEMDEETRVRAAGTVKWLRENQYPGAVAHHLERRT